MWIVGLLTPGGSSTVPESVRVAFHSFSDIGNPGSYTAHNGSWLLQSKFQPSAARSFNFTEWWTLREGETLGEPFDVCDEVVGGLLRALDMVCTLVQLQVLYLTRTTAGS